MPSQSANVTVTFPIGPAFDRVKRLLFQPFDLGKWFVIGFCAWLAALGQPGFHGGFNFGSPGRNAGRWFEEARDFVVRNLHWILPFAVALVVLLLAFWVLTTWLSSRGQFMFLHCVALDRAEVRVPWRTFAHEGNSLFLFRLMLGIISSIAILPLLAVAGLSVYKMIERGRPSPEGIAEVVLIALGLAALAIVFWIVAKLTKDFVVPIMFLRRNRWQKAWAELMILLSGNVGHFILYLLFQIVLQIAMVGIVLAVVVATCCVAGCLLVLPYVGTVLLLSILIFKKCYSLYYLAQYGREYDVFLNLEPPDTNVSPRLA